MTVRTAFGLRLCILLFWNVPELVVLFVNAHGVEHVMLRNQTFRFRSLVELENKVRTDFCFVENVRNAVRKDRVCIGMTIAVFCFVGVGKINHRKHIGCIAKRFGHLEMVTTVMPAAGQVVTDFGAVLQVAGFVKMRIRIAAALNAEELQ